MANYTPLNVKKMKEKPKSNKTNTVLIIMAIVTAIVLAFILILLIKQKMSPATQPAEEVNEQVIPSPLPESTEEATPSPELEQDQTIISTPTGSLEVSPAVELSPSVSPAL